MSLQQCGSRGGVCEFGYMCIGENTKAYCLAGPEKLQRSGLKILGVGFILTAFLIFPLIRRRSMKRKFPDFAFVRPQTVYCVLNVLYNFALPTAVLMVADPPCVNPLPSHGFTVPNVVFCAAVMSATLLWAPLAWHAVSDRSQVFHRMLTSATADEYLRRVRAGLGARPSIVMAIERTFLGKYVAQSLRKPLSRKQYGDKRVLYSDETCLAVAAAVDETPRLKLPAQFKEIPFFVDFETEIRFLDDASADAYEDAHERLEAVILDEIGDSALIRRFMRVRTFEGVEGISRGFSVYPRSVPFFADVFSLIYKAASYLGQGHLVQALLSPRPCVERKVIKRVRLAPSPQ
eukprot:gnl/Chilomastix_cuspidata/2470.p1 GENE.gnl/Chilomastix_cuspidata/2470~~gnl/Chilomastix_cuspidata/2470.p1  ORF type:complete len:347 (+),score=118.38 gnl/Chilomastix_cuspidata/2470:33-1073(+)